LGVEGRRVWREVTGPFELDLRELENLRMACAQLDLVARLDAVIERDGLTVVGSTGQPRLNPAVVEVRQARVAASRLLGELRLPDVDDRPMTARQIQAKRAVEYRWSRTAALREARRSGGAAS
jgi:hypothetical protein